MMSFLIRLDEYLEHHISLGDEADANAAKAAGVSEGEWARQHWMELATKSPEEWELVRPIAWTPSDGLSLQTFRQHHAHIPDAATDRDRVWNIGEHFMRMVRAFGYRVGPHLFVNISFDPDDECNESQARFGHMHVRWWKWIFENGSYRLDYGPLQRQVGTGIFYTQDDIDDMQIGPRW